MPGKNLGPSFSASENLRSYGIENPKDWKKAFMTDEEVKEVEETTKEELILKNKARKMFSELRETSLKLKDINLNFRSTEEELRLHFDLKTLKHEIFDSVNSLSGTVEKEFLKLYLDSDIFDFFDLLYFSDENKKNFSKNIIEKYKSKFQNFQPPLDKIAPHDEIPYALAQILRLGVVEDTHILNQFLIYGRKISKDFLVEFKDNLSGIPEQKLLSEILKIDLDYDFEKIQFSNSAFKIRESLSLLIKYGDKFPELKDKIKDKVLMLIRNQDMEGSSKYLIDDAILLANCEKINISYEELISTYLSNDYRIKIFLDKCHFVPEKYHQQIIDKIIKNQNFFINRWYIFFNKLKNINYEKFFNEFSESFSNFSNEYKELIDNKEFNGVLGNILDSENVNFLPQGLIEYLLELRPEMLLPSLHLLKDRVSEEKLVEVLIKSNKYEYIFRYASIENFFTINNSLIEKIIDVHGVNENLKTLMEIYLRDKTVKLNYEIFKLFKESFPLYALQNLNYFTGYTSKDVADLLRAESSQYVYIDEDTIPKDLDLEENLIDVLLDIDRAYLISYIIRNKTPNKEVLEYLYKKIKTDFGNHSIIFTNSSKFDFLNYEEVIDGFFNLIPENSENESLGIEKSLVLQSVFNIEPYILNKINIQKYIPKILKLNRTVNWIIMGKDLINGLKENRELGDEILKNGLKERSELHNLIEFNEFYKPPLNKSLYYVKEIFGEYATYDLFELFYKTFRGELSEEDKLKMKISASGEGGIHQLRDLFRNFKRNIIEGSPFVVDELLENSYFFDYFKSVVRYNVSAYGQGDDSYLRSQLSFLANRKEFSEINPGYTQSQEVRVSTIRRPDLDSFEYSEEFNSRFKTIKESLFVSLELLKMNEEMVLKKISEDFNKIIEGILKELNEKIKFAVNEKAKENIASRIKKLSEFKIPNKNEGELADFLLNNFESNFLILSQHQEFYSLLRSITFYVGLKKYPNNTEKIKMLTETEKPDLNQLYELLDFIDHLVNQETFANYFANKNSANEFRKITSTKAIEDEIKRMGSFETKGTTQLTFVPSRGLLMEFSGQISDACWASKYSSIAESCPNFTSIIMVQNKGTKNERLVGSCFLIETTASDGTPLLVIRGLNPLENLINSLDVADFYNEFTDYAQEIADRLGRRLAIVIDDHSGGSATNRPALFSYLESLKDDLMNIKLAHSTESTFNRYNIINDTYLVDA